MGEQAFADFFSEKSKKVKTYFLFAKIAAGKRLAVFVNDEQGTL